MKTRKILGQASWRLRSSAVEAWLTCLGGHLGPVKFRLGKNWVQPYAVAPWAEEAGAKGLPAVLRALRGDFFCLPFGGPGDSPKKGESHPLHGDTANGLWRRPRLIRQGGRTTLRVEVRSRFPHGIVVKEITLRDGHTAVYSRHLLSRIKGRVTFSHHPMLQFPNRPGSGIISTSAIRFGQVRPGWPEDPTRTGYSALAPGVFFKSLRRVARCGAGFDDLTRYPARLGYDDFALVASRSIGPFAWTTVTFPEEGYVWFALKDPTVLPSTLFWFANGGLHSSPANGRLRGLLGIEDIAGYFGSGMGPSLRANPFSRRGQPTFALLNPDKPLAINLIAGVSAIPRGFGRVSAITDGDEKIVLISGKYRVSCRIDHKFLSTRVR